MNDSGMAAIALSFQAGAGAGVNADPDDVAALAGLPRRARKVPVFPFTIPPSALLTTAVGTYVALTVATSSGWLWDITSLSVTGFTAGAVAVTKAGPAVTPAGAPVAIEQVAQFPSAGVQNFPQRGTPLLDANDDLWFTVTSALTAPAGVVIAGTAIMVPASRIDEYLT